MPPPETSSSSIVSGFVPQREDNLADEADVYIILSTLIGSLLIFAGGQSISYIDSLYFATGACTQAGLNPVDLNKLSIWQQVRNY